MKALESVMCQRTETKIKPQNPLEWLATQEASTKFYWSNREGDFQVAAAGALDAVSLPMGSSSLENFFDHIRLRLSDPNSDMRYYGGLAFDRSQCTEEWQRWGSAFFFLPQTEMIVKNGEHFLAYNTPSENKKTAPLQKISKQIPSLLKRVDSPNPREWQSSVAKILKAFENDGLQKVVLARRARIEFAQNPDPFALLQALQARADSCFCFLLQREGMTFLGASPERLYRREKKTILTEALAGTRPRGETLQQDQSSIEKLKASPKDLHEQKLVADMIQKALQTCCVQTQKDSNVSVLSLQTGHHLISRFQGELKTSIDDEKILKTLHPTPAVAGMPNAQAMEWIRASEPFFRGWYAGPVGYLGKDSSEFAVAIRSGLLIENHLHLYAGAGIVPGSDPLAEWEEVESKLEGFLQLFHTGEEK